METLAGTPVNLTASASIKSTPGMLIGIIVNSHTGGTLKFWNNTSAAGAILFNTITLAAGERYIPFYNTNFNVACFLTIGGTADVTVIYK